MSYSGYVFLAGYVVLVGVASFLQKFTMKDLTPYQINFLMAVGMLITAVPALWWKQGDLSIPARALPLGAPIGLLMSLGSIAYVLALARLPVGLAVAVSTSYVVVVAILARLFLGEPLGWMKVTGIALTLAGIALLSWDQS
jgi:drug/metabolite transporter (DMT)-like permease